MTRRSLLPAAALLALLAACSDDPQADAPGTTAVTTESVTTESPSTSAPAVTDAVDTTVAQPAGSCHVTITGDLEAEFTAESGPDRATTVDYRPWRQAADIELAPEINDLYLSLSCWSGEYYISLMSRTTPTDDVLPFPAQPATYTVYDGFCGGGWCQNPPADALEFIGFLVGPDQWSAGANGQLVITEFDDAHIAGTVAIELATANPSNAQLIGDKRAQLTIEFEFANPY